MDGDEQRDFCMQSNDAVSAEHFALNLPNTAGCGACELGKSGARAKNN